MIVPSRGRCLGSHLDKDIREGKKIQLCALVGGLRGEVAFTVTSVRTGAIPARS